MMEEQRQAAEKFLEWYMNDTYCFWPTMGLLFGYGLVAALFALFDMLNYQKLRLQSHKKIPAYELNSLALVAFNGIVIGPFTNWLFLDCWCAQFGVTANWDTPTLKQFACWFFWSYQFVDTFSYLGHRFLHEEPFYKMFHKLHHRYTNPNALYAIYTHPVEHVLVNLAPVLLSQVLVGNIYFTTFWCISVGMNTTLTHSGYGNYAIIHDLHHERFNVNYAFGWGLLDRINGTYVDDRNVKLGGLSKKKKVG